VARILTRSTGAQSTASCFSRSEEEDDVFPGGSHLSGAYRFGMPGWAASGPA
jgi:hypothetical protein